MLTDSIIQDTRPEASPAQPDKEANPKGDKEKIQPLDTLSPSAIYTQGIVGSARYISPALKVRKAQSIH